MGKRSRWILVASLVALMCGLGWAVYQRFTSQVNMRIAISQHRADDALLVTELAKWMAKNNRRTRLSVVMTHDEAAAVDAVRNGQADLASVRGDYPLPGGINSAAALYREVAIFVATAQSRIQDWPQVRGKTIALVGHTDAHDTLLQKILRARNITDAKFIAVERDSLDDLLKKNVVQVIAQIAPLNTGQVAEMKTGRNMRKVKGAAIMLELADAEALAAGDNRYEDYDVPAGGIRSAPPLPDEATSTLAVARHLVIASRVQPISVQKTLIDIMDAKRAIAADFPLARQIGSPGVEKDAAIKIHVGALSYFNGEEISLTDLLIDWIYIVPMVIGGLGAVLTWMYNLMWPADARRAQDAMVELLVMRREATKASTLAELDTIEKRRDEIQEEIDEQLSDGGLTDKLITALLVAADTTDRKISMMREKILREGRSHAQMLEPKQEQQQAPAGASPA
ncbi:MAG: hypothetical protein ACRCTD_00795 [Beijerinckiaceae bacterium]